MERKIILFFINKKTLCVKYVEPVNDHYIYIYIYIYIFNKKKETSMTRFDNWKFFQL